MSRAHRSTSILYFWKIVVARRWYDESIELVNTEVEFDEKSLQELKRNHVQMIADIEANLKLFLNTRWQNAKKHTLPMILSFDERNEVSDIEDEHLGEDESFSSLRISSYKSLIESKINTTTGLKEIQFFVHCK